MASLFGYYKFDDQTVKSVPLSSFNGCGLGTYLNGVDQGKLDADFRFSAKADLIWLFHL